MTPDEQRTLDELEQVLAGRFATAADLVRTGALDALVGGVAAAERSNPATPTRPAITPTGSAQGTTGQLPARR